MPSARQHDEFRLRGGEKGVAVTHEHERGDLEQSELKRRVELDGAVRSRCQDIGEATWSG
jgi:hypothetical protein